MTTTRFTATAYKARVDALRLQQESLERLAESSQRAKESMEKLKVAFTPKKLSPTATTWVAKDKDGVLTRIRVVDMEDDHLFRWIRYFRKKFRDESPVTTASMSDTQIDARIKASMVTATAIYSEAYRRGVIAVPTFTRTTDGVLVEHNPTHTTAETDKTKTVPLGTRKITLEEE